MAGTRFARWKTTAALAGAALWLSACGGGGEDTTAAAASSADEQYEQAIHHELETAQGLRCPWGPASAHGGGGLLRRCAEEPRPHDARAFVVNEAALPFAALAGTTVETDRWHGVLGNAGYRIEVPKHWNGMLVMYAHGYAGTGELLNVSNPSIRRHLIENGYAWAASSYSANYYDVRAGVEDTNALALAFNRIARDNGRPLPRPRKVYIVGHSMGGHITGAAIELETLLTARHKVR